MLFSTTNEDDEAVGPFDLGFDFNFYENTYDQLYISTNGLITFGDGSDLYDNQAIPRDTYPNNYITPFWDDLILTVDNNGQKISRVFYHTGSGAGGNYFAVEWYHLTRLGSQDKLTFEAILYENGDIVFQYQELNGKIDQATVGIEDEHGVDGSLYLHNAAGLSVSKAIKFTRPTALDWRVKVYPAYQSGLLVKRQATLSFTIRNTGNKVESDVFDLVISQVEPGWELDLFVEDGKTPMQDSDGDGKQDTGSLPPGGDFPVVLKVVAPNTSVVGDYIDPILTAVSSRDPDKKSSIQTQVAIPAPFAQASLDILAGPNLRLIWKENWYGANLNPGQQFTGSNLSVVSLPDKRYIYTWERNFTTTVGSETLTMANLEYIVMNRFGVVLKSVNAISDNSQADNSTEDRFLSFAGAGDGRIGATWVRTQRRESDQKINQNVYFAVLDSSGNMILDPINLTHNALWRGQDDYDVPVFISPRISATQDNHFVLAWGDERNHAQGSSADLFFATLDHSGDLLVPVSALTTSMPGETRYSTPSIVVLPGDLILVAYVLQDPGDLQDPLDDVSSTAYLVLDSEGSSAKNQVQISGSSGSTPDSYLISNGTQVVIGWSAPAQSQVQYILVDALSLDLVGSLVSLPTSKGRVPSALSVTGDDAGHAILTWGDAEQSDYLSYALIAENGAVATPPMVYTYGLGNNPLINTNSYGLGNAPYDGSWQVQLPNIQR